MNGQAGHGTFLYGHRPERPAPERQAIAQEDNVSCDVAIMEQISTWRKSFEKITKYYLSILSVERILLFLLEIGEHRFGPAVYLA
jgi:hypothetical protein